MADISKEITGELRITKEKNEIFNKEIKSVPDFEKKIKTAPTESVSELSEIILGGAISLEASDVHVEPIGEQAKIRVRIDGVLQDVTTINQKIYENLLSRIKLLSGIKLNITDRPQDGRFSVSINDFLIEIRVSTLPAEYGESIVLRILNPKTLFDLEVLGLREDLLKIFKKEIKKPNVMIIVTGPT